MHTPPNLYDTYFNRSTLVAASQFCTYNQRALGGLYLGLPGGLVMFSIGARITQKVNDVEDRFAGWVITIMSSILAGLLSSAFIQNFAPVMTVITWVVGVVLFLYLWQGMIRAICEVKWSWRKVIGWFSQEKRLRSREARLALAEAKLAEIRKTNPEFANWEATLNG